MVTVLDILTRIINSGHRSIQPLNSIRFSLNYNWLGPWVTMAVPFIWTFDFNFDLRMKFITFMLMLVATSPTDIM